MAGVVVKVPDDDEDLIVTDTNEAPRRRLAQSGDKQENNVGFDDLKQQLDRATKTREDADRRAAAAETRARRSDDDARAAREAAAAATTETVETRKTAIETALAAAKTQMDALEAEYGSAFEAGDGKKMAASQRRMSELGGEIAQLNSGRAAIAADTGADRGRRVVQEEPPRRRPTTEQEQFDDAIKGYSPRTQRWLRDHPEVVTSVTRRNEALNAHNAALAQNYEAESDEYFAYLDRQMKFTRAGRGSAEAEAIRMDNERGDDRDGNGRGEPMRSAPARGSSGGSGTSRDVHLTEGEVTNATDGTIVWNVGNKDRRGKLLTKDDPRIGEPIGVEEMARRKRDMNKEGRYATPML
jgi:hypothetical protein